MGLQSLPQGPGQAKTLVFSTGVTLKNFCHSPEIDFFRVSRISEIVGVLDSPYQGDKKVGLADPRISSGSSRRGVKTSKKGPLREILAFWRVSGAVFGCFWTTPWH